MSHVKMNNVQLMVSGEYGRGVSPLGTKKWTQTFFYFLGLFGRRRDIPPNSRDIPPKKFDFAGFEGHTELFGPHPLMWKTPTPPENIRTQKSGFVLFFHALSIHGLLDTVWPLREHLNSVQLMVSGECWGVSRYGLLDTVKNHVDESMETSQEPVIIMMPLYPKLLPN